MYFKEKGTIPVLVMFATLGLLLFIFVTSSFDFKNKLFSTLFPKPPSFAAGSTDTSYNLGVLVIKYFPLTSDGQNIDITVTGDVGDPYTTIKQRTIDVTNNLVTDLSKASIYLGYKNTTASPSLSYQIIDTREYTQAVPTKSTPVPRYPDYPGIMSSHTICDYVDNKNVREVWLWAYQGPAKSDGSPYLSISESKMSGPFGDISNSPRYNDMPVCKNTYRVYTFNYGRGTSEAMESWGHQIEAEVDAINSSFFRGFWQGPNYPQTLRVNGRCGSVHNPPNARFEYDRDNPNPQKSDCLDWNPDSLGTLSDISCQNWGCGQISDSNNPALNYMIWNWQNLPGRSSTKTYQGNPLRNFWDIHGDFDKVMGSDRTLFLTVTATPSPTSSPSTTPTPAPTSTPNPSDTTPPTVTLVNPTDGSILKAPSKINIQATASDNVKISKIEVYVNNSLKCTISLNLTTYSCPWSVPGKKNAQYTISVKVYDASNNTQSATITVTAK